MFDRMTDIETTAQTTVREQQESGDDAIVMTDLVHPALRRMAYRKRIAVRTRDRMLVLRVETIDWIEAQRCYVQLHTARRTYLVRESLREMAASLDPECFLRVHRSAIVNLDRVEELKLDAHGDLRLLLTGGTNVPVGRLYRPTVDAALGVRF